MARLSAGIPTLKFLLVLVVFTASSLSLTTNVYADYDNDTSPSEKALSLDVAGDGSTPPNKEASPPPEVRRLSDEEMALQKLLAEHHIKCMIAAREDQPSDGCQRAWDKVLCWPPSAPNSTVALPCPEHVPFLNAHGEGDATRWCDEDGNWASRSDSATVNDSATVEVARFYQGWTNYSECTHKPTEPPPTVDPLVQAWVPVVQKLSIVGYSFSLTTLVISFAILASIKKLRCPRNLLHLHLFASFILRAVVVLIRRPVLTLDNKNGAGCRITIALWQYLIAANHSWILMEGLYLHNLIFRALFTDSSAITLYVLLGWGMPAATVTAWSICKATLENTHCWLVNSNQWIFWSLIRAPTAAAYFINFFFFVNIVRVLATKLNSSTTDTNDVKYRKLAKSTLVLVPLFGIHYCLLWCLSISKHPSVELAYLLLSQGCTSFQGFFVAVLYCLMNGEVKQELKKLYHKYHSMEDNGYLTTYSTVMSNTRSYVSRARLSLPSIHADNDSKRDLALPRKEDDSATSPARGTQKMNLLSPGDAKECFEMKSLTSSDGSYCSAVSRDAKNNSPRTDQTGHFAEEKRPLLDTTFIASTSAGDAAIAFSELGKNQDKNRTKENKSPVQSSTLIAEEKEILPINTNKPTNSSLSDFSALPDRLSHSPHETFLRNNNNLDLPRDVSKSQSIVEFGKSESVAVKLVDDKSKSIRLQHIGSRDTKEDFTDSELNSANV